MCLHAQAHISANLGQIRKIEISMESGGHAGHDYDVCACERRHACMLACMHTIFWCAYAHISANLGQIRKIEISAESGGYAGHDYDVFACACMLVCMHTIFWHAMGHILAKFGWIREIKVSMESG